MAVNRPVSATMMNLLLLGRHNIVKKLLCHVKRKHSNREF